MNKRYANTPEGAAPKADTPSREHPGFRKSCPVCGRHFSLWERSRFNDWLGRRKKVICPQCDTALAWSEYPWLILAITSWPLIALNILFILSFRWRWMLGEGSGTKLALISVALRLAIFVSGVLLRLRIIKVGIPGAPRKGRLEHGSR